MLREESYRYFIRRPLDEVTRTTSLPIDTRSRAADLQYNIFNKINKNIDNDHRSQWK